MKTWILFFLLIFSINQFSYSQCPQFYDFDGNLSSTPEWIACDGNDFILSLQSNIYIGNYSIDWGDGSPQSSGTSWLANTPIEHTYSQTVNTYTVTINLTDIPCVVLGEVIMEEPTNASIQIPFGGTTAICPPGSLEFINSSTDVSENTVFTWSFFDSSADETYDFNNAGQLISHLYNESPVNCVTQVTLSAENECNKLQGGASVATFTPLRIWGIDDASISASNTLLCSPNLSVSFQNTTNRNCYVQGNVSQRFEYWNLGDYWGLGYDSIIDWRVWPPSLNVDVDFPGTGIYEVMLIDSSYCGLDSATISINIVEPPVAGLSADSDSICAGESVLFHNLTTGTANNYIWDFGDGNPWTQTWSGNMLRTFNTGGLYEVLLIPQIANACTDTARVSVFVSDSPTANFSLNNNIGCDSLTVQISNLSSADVNKWFWDFGNGITDSSSTPPNLNYDSIGTYNISLNVVDSNSCSGYHSDQVKISQTPTPYFEPTRVCVNQLSQFNDLSITDSNDPIINWSWRFGTSGISNLQTPTHNFDTAGNHNIILEVSTAYCQNKDTLSVTVEAIPITDFSTNINYGCSPMEVIFTNNYSEDSINYYWKFGDNYTSNYDNPTHVFLNNSLSDSVFNIFLVASTTFGCKDSVSKPITVFSNPIASFTNNAILDCAPLAVDFTTSSDNSTKYSWNFDDGTQVDSNTHVNHIFQNLSL